MGWEVMRVNVVQAWNGEMRFAPGAGGDACGTLSVVQKWTGDVHMGEVQDSMRLGESL